MISGTRFAVQITNLGVNNMAKGKPLKNGSGKGTGANQGRGGCKPVKNSGRKK